MRCFKPASLPMWCMAQADMSWLLAQNSLLETGSHTQSFAKIKQSEPPGQWSPIGVMLSSMVMWCTLHESSWLLGRISAFTNVAPRFHAAAPTATTTAQHWPVTWCSSSTVTWVGKLTVITKSSRISSIKSYMAHMPKMPWTLGDANVVLRVYGRQRAAEERLKNQGLLKF